MKFTFYIRKEGKEQGELQAVSFEFKGKPQCTSDIRGFMGDDQKSIHFRETSDTTDFQELMDRTVKQIGADKGFNTKITVDIPQDQIEIDHQPFMISGIYIPDNLIPTLETNSLTA
ncbi:MAG: hypothetical protein P8J32_04655 [bacterium]|nr:hypothetical protein [bacterium]